MANGRDLLTVKAIESAISAAVKSGERSELSDGGGLVLRCPPSGVAKWTYAYRSRSLGGMRRVTLGTFGREPPALTLAAARAARDGEETRNAEGGDPHAHRDQKQVEQAKADVAFAALCELYVEHVEGRGKLSWKTDEGYLNRPKAKFGKRAASSITKRELIDLLEEIARVSKSSANRTQSTLRTLWGWAAERDYVPMNFLAGVKKVGGKEAEKERVLTLDELKAFFAALDGEDAKTNDTIRRALRLILLTAQRPGEVAGMMLSELHDLDGTAPHWIIPAACTKNKKAEHTVPLSPTAVRLIGETLDASQDETPGANDQAVFASKFEGVTTLARHSLSQAVRRILDDKDTKIEQPFTPHDLRRTGATIAQAARLPVDFVKALLNHNDKGVTGVYARWHMFEEKREAVMAIEAAVLPLMA
jgi:integrase